MLCERLRRFLAHAHRARPPCFRGYLSEAALPQAGLGLGVRTMSCVARQNSRQTTPLRPRKPYRHPASKLVSDLASARCPALRVKTPDKPLRSDLGSRTAILQASWSPTWRPHDALRCASKLQTNHSAPTSEAVPPSCKQAGLRLGARTMSCVVHQNSRQTTPLRPRKPYRHPASKLVSDLASARCPALRVKTPDKPLRSDSRSRTAILQTSWSPTWRPHDVLRRCVKTPDKPLRSDLGSRTAILQTSCSPTWRPHDVLRCASKLQTNHSAPTSEAVPPSCKQAGLRLGVRTMSCVVASKLQTNHSAPTAEAIPPSCKQAALRLGVRTMSCVARQNSRQTTPLRQQKPYRHPASKLVSDLASARCPASCVKTPDKPLRSDLGSRTAILQTSCSPTWRPHDALRCAAKLQTNHSAPTSEAVPPSCKQAGLRLGVRTMPCVARQNSRQTTPLRPRKPYRHPASKLVSGLASARCPALRVKTPDKPLRSDSRSRTAILQASCSPT